MIPIKKVHILTVVFLLGTVISRANMKDTVIVDTIVDPLIELMKIQSAYHNPTVAMIGGVSDSTFEQDFTYYLEDHDTTLVKDTLSGLFIIQGVDNYQFSLGNISQQQSSLYLVTLYNDDSIMVINKPISRDKLLFQVDLLDTLLYIKQIKNITVKDSGYYRKILFDFVNESPFIRYEIVYDTVTYLLNYINYQYKKEVAPPGSSSYTPSHFISISMSFAPKSTFPDGTVFLEMSLDYLFTVQKGVFVPTPPNYINWTIINNTQQ